MTWMPWNVPVGAIISDNGSIARATARKLRDGSVLNRADYPGLFNEIKLINGLSATFDASATSGVLMTSNSLPSGYTASAKSNNSDAWKSADRNNTTRWTSANGETNSWWQLGCPKQIAISLFMVAPSDSYSYAVQDGNLSVFDGATLLERINFEALSWTSAQLRIFPLSKPLGITTFLMKNYTVQPAAGYTSMAEMGFYPPDLTKIKITGHPFATGDAVTVYNPDGALPNGYVEATRMYTRNIDVDHVSIHDTAAHASANTNAVPISDAGTGSFKIWFADTFPIGNVSNSYYAL